MPISEEMLSQLRSAYNELNRMQDLGNNCTVILTGSYVTGHIKPNSDVDLIVISRDIAHKYWGESLVGKYRINYAAYPEMQLVAELAVGNTALCLMVHHSLMLCGSGETYGKFKVIAEQIVKRSTEAPTDVRRFLMAKKLRNILDDMEDVKDTDPATLALLRNSLIEYSLYAFAKQSQTLLPNTKNRLGELRRKDSKLYRIVESLLSSASDSTYEIAKELCAYFGDWARIAPNTHSDEWRIEERHLPPKKELSFYNVPGTTS